MVERVKDFVLLHKTTVILAVVLLILLGGGVVAFGEFASQNTENVEEVDLIFDAEGPYALTIPRKDGNALILNLKRTSSYDEISYELAYTSLPSEISVSGAKILDEGEGVEKGAIDRGVVGTIDTKDRKGEYEQEILFGTCSRNVCKYDQGVENGTLVLRIKKSNKIFKMVTQWHLQKPDVALGILTSGDAHFIYKTEAERQVLSNVGYSIINDLTGVPKLPSSKEVLGKVYTLNVPLANELPAGNITLELAQDPPTDAKIFKYNPSKSEWEELGTTIEGSKLTARANGAGIFAVLTSNK